jgi:predicted CXXCH cytochrome family protein
MNVKMKKLLLASVITLVLLLAAFVTVFADNGPHGSFAATTDACAGCHRAHSAAVGSNQLLVKSDAVELCESCHDGSGAGTDVVNGVYHGTSEGTNGGSLLAGGFDNALMATAWSGKYTPDAAYNATPRATTSSHSLGVQGIVYGSGAVNATEATMTLECTACHDPHGNAGYLMTVDVANPPAVSTTTSTVPPNTNYGKWTSSTTKVATYRLLRYQPAGSGGFTAPSTAYNWSGGAFPASSGTNTGWTVPDGIATLGAEWYTIGTAGTANNRSFAVGDYNPGSATYAYNIDATHNYVTSAAYVAYFCAQCHDRYFANTRLRNGEDVSAFCGTPLYVGTEPASGAASGNYIGIISLTYYPDADKAAPWVHPVSPTRCEPVVDASTGALTAWGDTGSTGDAVHTYMHSSGDVLRTSADGAAVTIPSGTNPTPITAPASVGRTCVACHVAHGTAAQMTTMAGQANQVYIQSGALATPSSVLLRMDNRSLCLRCHASSVGFTTAP